MEICNKFADRITKIDANKSIDEVVDQVLTVIKEKLWKNIYRKINQNSII